MGGFGELSYDIACRVFPYLLPAQIFRCEGVNRGWRGLVREWTTTHGYEIMVQSDCKALAPTKSEDRMPYKRLKNHVKQTHCVETGRLLSVTVIDGIKACTLGQGEVAWFAQTKGETARWPEPPGGLFWRFQDELEDGCIQAKELFSPESPNTVGFTQLTANRKRTVLVHLETDTLSHRVVRAAVVSLQTKSIIFKRDYAFTLPLDYCESYERVNATIPYLLGDSRVYAGSWDPQKQKYLLEAYDLCTQQRLYRSDVLDPHWLWFNKEVVLYSEATIGARFNKLARTANGTELILQLSGAKRGIPYAGTGIKIIAGDNGQCIQIIPAPDGTTVDQVFTHPSSKQIVIVNMTGSAQIWDVMRTYWPYTIHRFVRTAGGDFAYFPAEVVFGPDKGSVGEDYGSVIAINPFTMTVVTLKYIRQGFYRKHEELFGCCLIPTNEPIIQKSAKEVMGCKFQEVVCDTLTTCREHFAIQPTSIPYCLHTVRPAQYTTPSRLTPLLLSQPLFPTILALGCLRPSDIAPDTMETPREDGIDRNNAVPSGEQINQCDRLPDELLLKAIGYLPLQDIITCERVNERWRQASKQCMEDDIRAFKNDDPLYAPGGVLQTEIQQQDQEIHFTRRHLMRTGNARNFLELSSALLALSGDFISWVEKPKDSNGPSDTLHWTGRPKQDTSVRDQTGSVSADCLWPGGPRPLSIYDVMCNDNGDVAYMALNNMKGEKFKLHIPHEMKYWTGGEMAACLLGQSSIYVAQPPDGDGRCYLGAYDIESGCKIWRSTKFYSWKQNDRSLFNVWRRGPDKTRPRVIETGHGKEPKDLILCPKEEHDQIDIIQGSSGHHLQSIEHPGRGIGAVLTHPISKKVAIVEELRSNQFSPPHAAMTTVLDEHRVLAIRHFDNEPETGLSPYHTDILIMPRVHSSWGQVSSDNPLPIAIDPFYMTAVGPDPTQPPNSGDWVVQAFQIVKAQDSKLRTQCDGILSAYLPGAKYTETPHEYFVPANSSPVHASRPDHRIQSQVKLEPAQLVAMIAQADGNGKIVFNGPENSYLLSLI
ncbi:F-box protein [Aspergillus stella-maris]|uniref:F-box protein n=1 Tax=Aspergillus stella-maris TaxID=1810926 RepID=UPI003CCD3685